MALLPIGPRRSDVRMHSPPQSASPLPNTPQSPHLFSRTSLAKGNIGSLQKSPASSRRGTGNLALQARDSVAIRKRTLSTGANSVRSARQSTRKPLEDSSKPDASPSTSHRNENSFRSHSPANTHTTQTQSNPPLSRNVPSPTPSAASSSPSQFSHPTTLGRPVNYNAPPSSFHTRAATHVPHNSQGTTTSAYPPSSSHSSRSSSPSPEPSRTPSPALPPEQPTKSNTSYSPALDLDPDDVNARLRLLVNNSYYLPPAHTKPELSPIYLSPKPSPPSTFKDFFRVGKRKDRKTPEPNPTSLNAKRPALANDIPATPFDTRFKGARLGEDLDLSAVDDTSRNRVVVVRETVDDLPNPVVRQPYRSTSLPTPRTQSRATDSFFIDPTTQYDIPPPTHYPSYAKLGLDTAGITGKAELDQFVPPGEPWSPTASQRTTMVMESQERVWRRALLEQAVDLSLSSGTSSEPNQSNRSTQDMTFALPPRPSSDDSIYSSSFATSRGKATPWRREIGAVNLPTFSAGLSSGEEHPSLPVNPLIKENTKPAPKPLVLGEQIVPSMETLDIDAFHRQHGLRIHPSVFPSMSSSNLPNTLYSSRSAPVTPLSTDSPKKYDSNPRPTLTTLDDVSQEFLPGQATIKKSLSSPLLSDMHETGVEVEDQRSSANNNSVVSLESNGHVAPSLILQTPHGVVSVVHSNASSYATISQASHADDDTYDAARPPGQHPYIYDDGNSLDQWSADNQSMQDHGDSRPSFDSYGASRVLSPDVIPRPARASSTFGFRRSSTSVSNAPSRQATVRESIEVDITGDPMEHLSMMGSHRAHSPGADSQAPSIRGYPSPLDHTFYDPEVMSAKPPSFVSQAQTYISTKTRMPLVSSETELELTTSTAVGTSTGQESETLAPISFFDNVQRQSFLNSADDSTSSESDIDIDEPTDDQTVFYEETKVAPQRPRQPSERKSFNATRPTIPAFATQFRNASQPQLPISRGMSKDKSDDTASLVSFVRPYDLLDRKKPVSNSSFTGPPVSSSGLLSQFKSHKNPILSRYKKPSTAPSVIHGFDPTRYPPGSTFAFMSSSVEPSSSDHGHGSVESEPVSHSRLAFQRSLPSINTSTSSLGRSSMQHEALRQWDGLVFQHMEAEKDRLRKIANAAREKAEAESIY